jgi:hypothetical protein
MRCERDRCRWLDKKNHWDNADHQRKLRRGMFDGLLTGGAEWIRQPTCTAWVGSLKPRQRWQGTSRLEMEETHDVATAGWYVFLVWLVEFNTSVPTSVCNDWDSVSFSQKKKTIEILFPEETEQTKMKVSMSLGCDMRVMLIGLIDDTQNTLWWWNQKDARNTLTQVDRI